MEITPEDIRTIYILILKNHIKASDIPNFWLAFQTLTKEIDSNYELPPLPGFVKLLMRYRI